MTYLGPLGWGNWHKRQVRLRNCREVVVSTSLNWMVVLIVGCSGIPPDFEGAARSWDFLRSCLFLVGLVV